MPALSAGMPWANRLITYRTGKGKTGSRDKVFRLGRLLKSAKFDLAILLPGSFKTALVCKLASIPRIVGYERDGRGMLLTDKLLPLRYQGQYVPTPIVKRVHRSSLNKVISPISVISLCSTA